MSRSADFAQNHYAPLLQKTLQNALAHVIAQQFPRIGGSRMQALCAQIILEVVQAHVRPTKHMRHGQRCGWELQSTIRRGGTSEPRIRIWCQSSWT